MKLIVKIQASEVTRLVELFAQGAADLVEHVTSSFGPDDELPRAHISMWVTETVEGHVYANMRLGDPDDPAECGFMPPKDQMSVTYAVADTDDSTARDVVRTLRSRDFRTVIADRDLVGTLLGHARCAALLTSDQAKEIAA